MSITNGKQYLYYYGASHVNDPKHPMLPDIEAYWDEFMSRVTDKSKAVAMNEGGLRNPNGNKDAMVKRDGEGGLLTYLSKKDNIEIISPEPSRENVDNVLLNDFSKEEVQYYYFARVVNQFLNKNTSEDFEKYVQRFLDTDKKESGWTDFDFSLENMKKTHIKLFGDEFNINEKGFFYTIINPSRKDTVVNAVARASSDYRDVHIVEKTVEEWNLGKSVFVVYGFSHGYRQEPALNKLLK